MTIGASAARAGSGAQPDGRNDDAIDIDGCAEDLAERSARNIAAWQSYLPADCIAAMIVMGWDKST